MKYRKFGKLDWMSSALGFGCMRLPTLDGNPMSDKIDEAESLRMIRHSVDSGINYIDTAYFYHNENSENVVGKALLNGYREKVRLATKCPIWYINDRSDFDRYLDIQLKKLKTEHIDFYLFHGLNSKTWDSVNRHDLLTEAEKAVKRGKIGHIGFSFHDGFDTFQKIINGYDGWSFCQIQYNYMDTDNQAGTRGLKLAASKGLAIVIMEPLLGGKLANPPDSVRELFDSHKKRITPAELALRWVWNQPEISVVLSGMNTMKHLEENLGLAGMSSANSMDLDELVLVEEIEERFRERTLVPCTGCGYCLPCSKKVDIPRNIKMYNDGYMYDEVVSLRFAYKRFLEEESRAGSCVNCGACEIKCPQKIKIGELMPRIHSVLGDNNPYQDAP